MSSHQPDTLFFLALLLPDDIEHQILQIKHEFANRYHSRHALKTPGHITLFPPFRWPQSHRNVLGCLTEFCRTQMSIPIEIQDFGIFAPRVIFAKPPLSPLLQKTYIELQTFLWAKLELADPIAQKRVFTPHITVAHRDLTPDSFNAAWAEFQTRSLRTSFVATHLTLLQHDGERWQVSTQWPFGNGE